MGNLFDEIPDVEPLIIRAGDFVQWRKPDLAADYPPSVYALEYQSVMEANASIRFTLNATDLDGVFDVSAASAATASYETGVYHWVAVMTRISDGAKRTVNQGRFEVLADLATATGDQRSHHERMLAQLEALLEGRAKSDVDSYEIAGRKIAKLSPEQLMDWAAKYRRLVRKEREQRAGNSGRKVHKVRFL
ncbi:hypothetical protein [Roseibium polysiphoniae]|uniref:Uncharacterized protein n=1 Tax=Roseibium polysiphoniae TaxID=2571221 RepID=A0ABR9C756_9HYPH|nr:hypothetical protein [Roseibium polysiphoniae]MBD8875428.1 hypothetical protein [Roseibium polysiphoniae]